jgi:hypothetical protein
MISEEQILSKLDNHKLGRYCQFVNLGHVYSYLIDSRLNVFKGDKDRWAIVGERLGYNPRSGGILLDIYYFGNCLTNLESYNGQDTNYYIVTPIKWDDFFETSEEEVLKPDARFWTIRETKVELSHNKEDYLNAGVELKEYKPREIRLEEVGRLLVVKHRDLLRATDQELYKSIPKALKKILVIDEWYHRDYMPLYEQHLSQDQINITYEVNKQHFGEGNFMDYESFVTQYKQDEKKRYEKSLQQWLENLPSAYETWQLIAKVIATGDTLLYQPTLAPNSHWKNWPESGSM